MENTSNGIRIRIGSASVFGYVHSRAGIPLVDWVGVEAPEELAGTARLRLDFSPEIFRSVTLRLGRLGKGSRVVVPKLGEAVVSALLGSTAKNVKITATVLSGGTSAAAKEKLVPLVPFDSFSPASVYPSLAAAFVVPDCAAVKELAERISGGVPAEKFYSRTPCSGVASKLKEVYELLKECGIAYSVRQYSAEKTSEHVKPAPVCLRTKNADSLELALVFASVCEALGLDATVLFFSSTVSVAVRLGGEQEEFSESHDSSVFASALGEGAIEVFDPSGICYGTDIPFQVSCDRARKTLLSEPLIAAVNVRAARREGILPLPSELCGDEAPLGAKDILTSAPEIKKENVKDELFCELSRRKGYADLTDFVPVTVPVDPEAAIAGESFELEKEASQMPHPSLCLGTVGYFDPIREKRCRAPVLLLPMTDCGDGKFAAHGAVCNSVLFERLAELSGFDAGGALSAFAEGVKALFDFVSTAASMSDSFDFDEKAVCAASIRTELAAAHAALRRFALPAGGAEIPVVGGKSFDKTFNRALETSLSGGFTAVRIGDPSVRESFALSLAANALNAGHRVLVVSGEPERFVEKLGQLASDKKEVRRGGFDGESLEQVFRDRAQGFSFYTAMSLADKYRGAEKPVELPPVLFEGLTERGVDKWSAVLAELTDAMEKTGGIPENPLRFVSSPSFGDDTLENARLLSSRCVGALQSLIASISDASSLLQVPESDGREFSKKLTEALKILAEGEKIPHYYFENRLPDTVNVVRTMKNHWDLKKELEKKFSKDVFTLDVLALKSSLRSAALLGGHKKKALEKSVYDDLRGCALGDLDRDSVHEVLDGLDRVREYGDYTLKNSEHLRSCLGVDVTSPDTEKEGLWERLERICLDADRFESAYLALGGSDPAAIPSVLRTPELPERAAAAVSRINEALGHYQTEYNELKRLLGLEMPQEPASGFGADHAFLSALRDGIDGLEVWTDWLKIRLEAISLGLGDAVKQCESGAYSKDQIRENFLCGFFNSLCCHMISVSPALSAEETAKQDELMKLSFENDAAILSAAAGDLSGLVSSGLTSSLSDPGGYSLVIVADAHLVPGCIGAGLLSKGRSVVTVGDPLCDGSFESLSELAIRFGASDCVISGFISSSVIGADAACRFAFDLAGTLQSPVYPAPERFGARILCVKGGYDDATATNVIEAKVIVDELEDCVRSGVKSVGIVTLGNAQKLLVTRMLAGKLSQDPELREMLIGKDGVKFYISSFDEDPGEADVVLLSLCFASSESGYAKGLSPKLFSLLGSDRAYSLSRLFTLAGRFLTVTCSFGFEELSNTCSTLAGVRQFRLFCAGLFALENSPDSVDLFPDRPHEPVMERIADKLRSRGWIVLTDCGFGKVRTDIMIQDPFDPVRRFAVLSDAALKDGVDPVLAYGLISGFLRRGIAVFRFPFARWFTDPASVESALDAFLGSDPGLRPPFEEDTRSAPDMA
ncbi:MAG: hypothetical protein IJV00_09920 [Clostridia bacterium]|nr:hypothetical protein [Clostridia bacterium]